MYKVKDLKGKDRVHPYEFFILLYTFITTKNSYIFPIDLVDFLCEECLDHRWTGKTLVSKTVVLTYFTSK